MATRSLRDLLEQPVVTRDDVFVGEVADAYLEPAEQRIVKLSVDWVVSPDQVTGPERDLPLDQVTHFEPHQLIVGGEVAQTAGLDYDPLDAPDLLLATGLLDREVVTRSGDPLGDLADIYFDDSDGAVSGYEVEQPDTGMPARILVPSPDMELAGDRMIVPDNFQVADPREFAFENAIAQEEQDLVFDTGAPDRRFEDPTAESPDERPERDRILD